jgi:hypothetical protein
MLELVVFLGSAAGKYSVEFTIVVLLFEMVLIVSRIERTITFLPLNNA